MPLPVESYGVSSSGNHLLVWLRHSCSMAHRPGELPQNFLANLAIELLTHFVQKVTELQRILPHLHVTHVEGPD